MESTTLHYFFLDHFKGNSLAVRLQQHYKEGKECDVIVSCPITKDRRQSKDVLEIRVHSQVVAAWSKFLEHLIRKERVTKIISEEEPFTIYLPDTTPDMLRLITDMMYTGSAVVSSLLLKKFKRTVKLLKIKVIEKNITATPESRPPKPRFYHKVAFEGVSDDEEENQQPQKFRKTPYMTQMDAKMWMRGGRHREPVIAKDSSLQHVKKPRSRKRKLEAPESLHDISRQSAQLVLLMKLQEFMENGYKRFKLDPLVEEDTQPPDQEATGVNYQPVTESLSTRLVIPPFPVPEHLVSVEVSNESQNVSEPSIQILEPGKEDDASVIILE